MEEYITEKVNEFETNYHPELDLNHLAALNPEIHKMWKDECAQKNVKWRRIKTNQDVIQLIDKFDKSVQFVEENVKFGDGHIEDAYYMELAAYNALQGLRKLTQGINQKSWLHSDSDFSALSDSEVDELFIRMNEIAERMNFQNQRRAMQD